MALGLEQIKNKKKERKAVLNEVKFVAAVNDNFEREIKEIRPWQGYDSGGLQARTLLAQEAIRKARKIVDRNNRMTQVFSEDYFVTEEMATEQIDKTFMTEKKKFTEKVREFVDYYLM